MIANTPKPTYYAVIFSSDRTEINDGYSEMVSAKHHQDAATPSPEPLELI